MIVTSVSWAPNIFFHFHNILLMSVLCSPSWFKSEIGQRHLPFFSVKKNLRSLFFHNKSNRWHAFCATALVICFPFSTRKQTWNLYLSLLSLRLSTAGTEVPRPFLSNPSKSRGEGVRRYLNCHMGRGGAIQGEGRITGWQLFEPPIVLSTW